MNDEKRSKMINIRLNGKELQIFENLCRQDVRSSASMLRFLIMAEHERRRFNLEERKLLGDTGAQVE